MHSILFEIYLYRECNANLGKGRWRSTDETTEMFLCEKDMEKCWRVQRYKVSSLLVPTWIFSHFNTMGSCFTFVTRYFVYLMFQFLHNIYHKISWLISLLVFFFCYSMGGKINGIPSSSYCGIRIDANSTHVEEKGKGEVRIACFCLHNFIIPWCFKLTQFLL